jgi:hypothetical protein
MSLHYGAKDNSYGSSIRAMFARLALAWGLAAAVAVAASLYGHWV